MRQRALAVQIAAQQYIAAALSARGIKIGGIEPHLVCGHGNAAALAAADVVIAGGKEAAARTASGERDVTSLRLGQRGGIVDIGAAERLIDGSPARGQRSL